jgi:hypothetical protein
MQLRSLSGYVNSLHHPAEASTHIYPLWVPQFDRTELDATLRALADAEAASWAPYAMLRFDSNILFLAHSIPFVKFFLHQTQPQQLSVFIHHQLVFPVFNQSRPPFDLAAADAAAAAAARRARRRRPPAPPPDAGPAPGGDSPPASFTRSHISLFILPAAPQRETSVRGPCREFDIVYR